MRQERLSRSKVTGKPTSAGSHELQEAKDGLQVLVVSVGWRSEGAVSHASQEGCDHSKGGPIVVQALCTKQQFQACKTKADGKHAPCVILARCAPVCAVAVCRSEAGTRARTKHHFIVLDVVHHLELNCSPNLHEAVHSSTMVVLQCAAKCRGQSAVATGRALGWQFRTTSSAGTISFSTCHVRRGWGVQTFWNVARSRKATAIRKEGASRVQSTALCACQSTSGSTCTDVCHGCLCSREEERSVRYLGPCARMRGFGFSFLVPCPCSCPFPFPLPLQTSNSTKRMLFCF